MSMCASRLSELVVGFARHRSQGRSGLRQGQTEVGSVRGCVPPSWFAPIRPQEAFLIRAPSGCTAGGGATGAFPGASRLEVDG